MHGLDRVSQGFIGYDSLVYGFFLVVGPHRQVMRVFFGKVVIWVAGLLQGLAGTTRQKLRRWSLLISKIISLYFRFSEPPFLQRSWNPLSSPPYSAKPYLNGDNL